MTNDAMYGSQGGRRRLGRSRGDRVFGGVCAGLADYLGVDSRLVRIVVVVLALASGGTAILAYLIAWILLPPAAGEQRRPPSPPRAVAGDGSARDAWTAAGSEVRSLAAGLRPVPAADAEAARTERSRAAAVDAAMTALGDRLRDPEVRAGARRAAVGVSAAVGASVEELGRRSRRGGTPPT